MIQIPKEYHKIKESLRKAHSKWGEDELSKRAAMTFADTFGISLQKADKLAKQGLWESWKKKHGFGTKSHRLENEPMEFCSEVLEVKSEYGGEKGRYAIYDLMVSNSDARNDIIPPQTIQKITKKLKGLIGYLKEPKKVMDVNEVQMLGALTGGIGHEHHFLNKEIVPASSIVDVKSVMNDTRMRIVTKINEASSRADDLWNMIQERIMPGISIEYKANDPKYEIRGDKLFRILDDLTLTGYSHTAKPMQSKSMLVNCFVKALEDDSEEKSEKNDEVKTTMEGEKKEIDEQAKEEEKEVKEETKEPEAEVKEEEKEEEEVKALETKLTSLQEENKSMRSSSDLESKLRKIVSEEVKSLQPEQKSQVEEDQKKEEKETEEVKSILKNVKTFDDAGKVMDTLIERDLFNSKGALASMVNG